MKSIFRIILFAMVMTAFCINTYAQRDNKQRLTREQLAETQANYIAQKMAMDGTTTEKFVATFCQYQKDIWALGPRPKRGVSDRTETQTSQTLKERFAHSQKILDLRQKYYVEYSKFLSQQQIERVYELEKRMMDRLFHRSHKQKTKHIR